MNKKECLDAVKYLYFTSGEYGKKDENGLTQDFRDKELLKQLINEHFDLQLTSSECDFIISTLEPYEDELGMDITLLIDKLRKIQRTLLKEEGVVTCVEFE